MKSVVYLGPHMKLGVSLPVGGTWATPSNLVAVATRAEELGYSSAWTFQRLLYPAEPRDHYPYGPKGPWPKVFESVIDSVVALSYVAAATSKIRLGTAVVNLPYLAPVAVAKQLASLDVISGGRLDVGVGVGWSRDEFEAVGVPHGERGARTDEYLQCIKAVWTQEIVEFDGRFCRVPASRVDPKPLQQPHPPILVGGYAPKSIERAVTLGDGYLGGNVPLARIAPLLDDLAGAAERAGRDFAGLRIVSRGSLRVLESPPDGERRALWGTLEQIRTDIESYREAGLTELFLEFNFDPDIWELSAEAALDRALGIIEELAP